MRLWIESAQWSSAPSRPEGHGTFGAESGDIIGGAPGDLVNTLTTEEAFVGLVASGSLRSEVESRIRATSSELVGGAVLEALVDGLLSALPAEGHVPLSLLHVRGGTHLSLLECDAPPLFMARRGRLVLLPVVEEEQGGHLVRRCEFELRDGDHLAMVSEGYIQGIGGERRSRSPAGRAGGWREVAVSVRRLTETRCSAEQLAGALVRQYQRQVTREQEPGIHDGTLAISHPPSAISVLAMFVRPMRSITIWSGPPASRAAERDMLGALMAEEDMRAVCGDTTAEIAARMLEAELVMEPPPLEGWAEVPPVSRMALPDGNEAVTLVTEGVVTMRVVRQRFAETSQQNRANTVQARALMGRADGASRLAYLLLTADKVRFLVGLAVNPAQVTANGTPLRQLVIEELAADLKTYGKIVSVEYF